MQTKPQLSIEICTSPNFVMQFFNRIMCTKVCMLGGKSLQKWASLPSCTSIRKLPSNGGWDQRQKLSWRYLVTADHRGMRIGPPEEPSGLCCADRDAGQQLSGFAPQDAVMGTNLDGLKENWTNSWNKRLAMATVHDGYALPSQRSNNASERQLLETLGEESAFVLGFCSQVCHTHAHVGGHWEKRMLN